MTVSVSSYRSLAIAAILSLGVMAAGCSSYEGDVGAKRSQQQSETLQNRIKTTQVDR